MADVLELPQLRALAWLKWRLLRNSLRSRRAAADSAASALGTLAALALSLVVAAGVGVAAYALAKEAGSLHGATMRGEASQPALLLFGLVTVALVLWALLPLSLGSGSQFDPGPLLLYPVSLRQLFAVDLLSEFASLPSLFAAPSVLAIGVGAGLAAGRPLGGLLVAVCAVAFGQALSKLFATSISALMRRRRARGETVLALVGLIAALSGVIIQQSMLMVERAQSFPASLRWTPPGAATVALTSGLRAGGAEYAVPLATLALYAFVAVALTYRVAVASLRGGGGKAKTHAVGRAEGTVRRMWGWQLPLVSATVSTVFEKELRYVARNAQLRVMTLMPVVMTFALRLSVSPRRTGLAGVSPRVAPYFEGARAGLSVFYAFVIMSALTANTFGFDGAGMRALILSPASRRAVLAGKNLATLSVTFVSALVVTIVNGIVYGDVTPHALLFAALVFAYLAGVFHTVGNEFSMRFPRRLRFGKRMGASGMAGVLMILVFIATLLPVVGAVLTGWLVESVWIEYVILALLAGASVATYFLLLDKQGRELTRREVDILEAVTVRDGS